MNPEMFLIVASFFITLALSVIAYLLKSILNELNEIKLDYAKLITEHDIYKKLVMDHDDEFKKTRERLHSLEGANAQMLSYIKDHNGN